ncbi:MBL fold metallo-hydrolase [Bordetella muralis]|jgi:glyoxylase-like metal-dependent hydrolase (beta-lactamase superfamily II)|uniref:MBL fold metallo-hydrolase n=1 Tax=Bordetella muralis TaxID=1649130 RepID=UPI0039EF574D
MDTAQDIAISIVQRTLRGELPRPDVHTFFDPDTFTASHIVRDPGGDACAIIDSVLDFDYASGRTAETSAMRMADHIKENGLHTQWVLETHAHADHLSAAPLLISQLGGRLAIGKHITTVQNVFGKIFNAGTEFARDGTQFDELFEDGDQFQIGSLQGIALHVPGHTPACMAYVIGDTVFTGDTLFMPDYGTARCDFPGGDAAALYRSIQRLLALPDATRVFVCHDYKAPGRDVYAWETTIADQRASNIHVHAGIDEQTFVAMREKRDATLSMPKLILPSIQVNMCAGQLPAPEDNGVRYLKLPLNVW